MNKVFLPIIVFVLTLFLFHSPCLADQSAWHFKPSDVNALHSKPADHQLAYGKDPLQFGELRLPTGKGPHPVAIIIHGGCWVSTFADLKNTSAFADALRDLGIATWNIEYRRTDNQGGGWPGTFQDVANGADFLKTIAPQYSFDLNRVIVIGQSAGGHLALWLAARHRLPKSSELYTEQAIRLQGVIVLGGVPDLKGFRSQGNKICNSDVIGALLGNSSAQIEQHYQEASPIELLPLGLPQFLIYGKDDQAVPATFGANYAKVAQKKGDKVKVITVPYAAHHEYLVPNSVTWPAIQSIALSLLHLK